MATVAPRHVFGIKADVKDNTSYFDEQTVLYAAGNNVVIFNTEQKSQKFIPGTEKSEGITALAVSPNRNDVAVAERGVEGEKAQVTVYDLHTLKRRKVRAFPAARTRPVLRAARASLSAGTARARAAAACFRRHGGRVGAGLGVGPTRARARGRVGRARSSWIARAPMEQCARTG
jgi:hypothetical protein